MSLGSARSWLYAIAAYLAVYGALLAAMHRRAGFAVGEPLFVLAVYGVAFSALAWLTTAGLEARAVPVRAPRAESRALLAYLIPLSLFVAFGFTALHALSDTELVQDALIVGAKLIAFIGLPVLALHRYYGYSLRDYVDLRRGLAGHSRPLLFVAAALVAFQLWVGRAGRELPPLHAGAGELTVGTLIALAGSTLEAGLVEEFFFRTLLLQRLLAWLRVPAVALVLSVLLFGLAHAPGLYLRASVTGEAVSEHSVLFAVGYAVVISSVAGFMFGVLWLRTRNLLLVALLHGVNDCVPAIAGTISWLRAAVSGGV